jgi:quercetin dioxygenase-like cupin family protein
MNTLAPSEVIRVGQIEIRFRLQASQTDGQLTMFEFQVPAKARVPVPHSHVTFDETIYGLNGILTWTMDGPRVDVGPGDVLFIRRGTVHQFENVSSADARALSVITPGSLGPEYFRDVGAIVNAGGPPKIQEIMAVMQRHGLCPVLPSSQRND